MSWADVIAIVLIGAVLLIISAGLLPIVYDRALRLVTAALIERQRRRPP